MSGMFGSTKALPPPASNPYGIDNDLAPTNRQTRPVPYLAGRRRVGVTWIGQAYNVVITDAGGGAKKGGGATQKDYTASAAALVCHGPVDELSVIVFDNQIAWEGNLTRGESDYVDVTIEGRGMMRIYWGTNTQGFDPELEALATDPDPDKRELHSAYRGFCYIVFRGLYLGTSRTQFPQVELVVGRWPVSGFLPVSSNVQGDAHPIAIIHDWMSNPRVGPGISTFRLGTTQLASIAGDLTNECAGISPYVTSAKTLRQLLAELCEYIDALFRPSRFGLIELVLIRGTCVTTPVYDEDDLTAEPKIDPGDWSDVKTQAIVRFTNRANGFKEDSATAEDLGAYEILGTTEQSTLERRWVTRPTQAWVLAQAEARNAGVPPFVGVLRVRRSRWAGVRPGDQFRLSWAQYGLCNLACRATDVVIPPPGKLDVEISFRIDRGHLSALLAPPPAYVPPPRLVHGPIPFEFARVIELPCALTPNPDSIGDAWRIVLNTGGGGGGGGGESDATKRAVSFLCQRPGGLVDGWTAHYKLPTGAYTPAGSSRAFAQRATLTGDVFTLDTEIEVQFTGVDLVPPDSVEPGSLALIIGDEWCFVEDIAPPSGPATYVFSVIRGAAGTDPLTYGSGSEAWLVKVSDLLIVTALSPGTDHWFKLTPSVLASQLPLADAAPIPVTLVLACVI